MCNGCRFGVYSFLKFFMFLVMLEGKINFIDFDLCNVKMLCGWV